MTATIRKLDPRIIEALSAPVALSDDELALRFATVHKDKLRHVDKWGKWFVWNKIVGVADDLRYVFSLARELCREVAAPLLEKGKSLASHKTVAAVVSLARCDQDIAAGIDQWDTHALLLNTPDGIVDLKTGQMLTNVIRLDFYMTRVTSVSPSSEGCPLFRKFLNEITGGDEDLQKFLIRVFGYCLTGLTIEHSLFFFYGTGANGKSVIINLMSSILNDYHRTAPMEALIASQGDRHPTELAGLMGRRLVTAIETEEGKRWADAKIKQLTGGDEITARFMRQDYFEYTPQFKLVVAGNHKTSVIPICSKS